VKTPIGVVDKLRLFIGADRRNQYVHNRESPVDIRRTACFAWVNVLAVTT
jgi:hypothetical protein